MSSTVIQSTNILSFWTEFRKFMIDLIYFFEYFIEIDNKFEYKVGYPFSTLFSFGIFLRDLV